jgi:hypothetical protein
MSSVSSVSASVKAVLTLIKLSPEVITKILRMNSHDTDIATKAMWWWIWRGHSKNT